MAHSLKTDHIQFIPGMRQDLTPENAPAGTLYVASNVRYSRQGGIERRPGIEKQSSTTQGSSHEIQGSGPPSFLSRVGDTALFGTGQGEAFALDESGIFNFCGAFSSCLPLSRTQGLVKESGGGFGTLRWASASNPEGYTLVASGDGSGTVYISVQSRAGVTLTSDTALGSKCSAIAVQSKLVLVVQNGTSLVAYVYTITSGTVSVASATLATLTSSASYWDLSPGPTSQPGIWWLIYRSAAAVLTIATETTSPSVSNPSVATVAITGNAPCSVFWDDTNAHLWVGWCNDPTVTGDARVRAFSAGGTALCAVTTLGSSIRYRAPLVGMPVSGTGAFFTYVRTWLGVISVSSTNYPSTAFGTLVLPANPANTATVVAGEVFGVAAISKPDSRQRSWCLTVPDLAALSTGETVTQRCMLLAWNTNTMSGASTHLSTDTYEQDLWFGWPDVDMFGAISEQSGTCTYVLPRRLRIGVDGSAGLFGLDVYVYESSSAHPWRSTVRMGRTTVVAGQPVEVFTNAYGTVVNSAGGSLPIPRHGSVEIGFPVAPQIITLAQSVGTGLLTLTGTYSYVVVTEWIDGFGRRHRSPPSVPETITLTGANSDVTLTISCQAYGERWPAESSIKPVHHVYRTENGGTVHYRVTPGAGAPTADAPGAGKVTFLDLKSDVAAVATGDALYVDAAQVDYALAPSCRFAWRDDRRVWFGGLWEQDQIACTLDVIPDQPLEFSDFEGGNGPVFRISVNDIVTGGESQDGVNYVFSRDAIYAFSGDGPDRQGNGDFSSRRTITNETGCKDYRSVRATSVGIFFQSDRGIELLPRGGGNPVPVGAPIQDLLDEFPLVLGTAIHSDTRGRQIRFLLSNEDQSITRIAIYDLKNGCWSNDEHVATHQCIGEWPNATAMAFVDQAENVCADYEVRDSDIYTDGSSNFSATVRTTVIRPWGPVGLGRLNHVALLVSETNNGDQLHFEAVVDGATKFKDWTMSLNSGSSYRQLTTATECTSFYVEAQITRTAAAQNPNLHGITVELGQLEGSRRLPASEQ